VGPDIPDTPSCGGAVQRAFEAVLNNPSAECTPFTKVLVFQAVDQGWIRLDEALTRYRVGLEEYRSWQNAAMR
jgi:hypothetical protein